MASTRRRPWLDRYEHPLPIRSRGAFHLVSATRTADARPCVVVVPSPFAGAAPAAEVLREIQRVHGLLDHPAIPPVTAIGEAGGAPYLELDCDATMDGVELLEHLTDAGCKVPLAFADGFITHLRRALASAHARTDPASGGPVCMGRISAANILFARSGRSFLVGFGHGFPLDPGEIGDELWTPVFAAPEVLVGEAPSPAGDQVALLLLARSLLPFVDLGPALARLLDTDARGIDAAVLAHLRWANRHLLEAPAHLRSSVEEAEVVMDRLRALCGVTPDLEGFEHYLRTVLDRCGVDAPGALDGEDDERLLS